MRPREKFFSSKAVLLCYDLGMGKEEVAILIIENLSLIMNVLWGIMGVVAVIFIGGIVWVWKLSSIFTKFKSDISDIKINISKFDSSFDGVNRKLSHIDCHLVKLDIHDKKAPDYSPFSAFTQASSPLTLTQEGEVMVKKSGFYEAINENKGIFEGIIANAKGRADKEAFIEKAAFEKVESLFEEDNVIVANVSQFMYENGMRQSKLIYNGAIRAFSVAARDLIFKEMDIEIPVPKQNRDAA